MSDGEAKRHFYFPSMFLRAAISKSFIMSFIALAAMASFSLPVRLTRKNWGDDLESLALKYPGFGLMSTLPKASSSVMTMRLAVNGAAVSELLNLWGLSLDLMLRLLMKYGLAMNIFQAQGSGLSSKPE